MKKALLNSIIIFLSFSCQSKVLNSTEERLPANEATQALLGKCENVATSVVAFAVSRAKFCPENCNMAAYLTPLTKGIIRAQAQPLPNFSLQSNSSVGYVVKSFHNSTETAQFTVQLDDKCNVTYINAPAKALEHGIK